MDATSPISWMVPPPWAGFFFPLFFFTVRDWSAGGSEASAGKILQQAGTEESKLRDSGKGKGVH